MILPCSGGRTTKISAFYQIIERNYQGPKIFIKSKIVRKCLRRRNNYLSKMPLKEPITEPTYCKYRGLTYVTKCKYAPNSFHSQPQAYPLCTTKPTKILLRFSLIFVLSYVFMFCASPPPSPYITITSPPPILARIQQTFCGDQHKSKKILFLSLRAKQVLKSSYRDIYETSSCREDIT